ncbi:MAG: hypothetical protein Q9179_004818 [Wetmoreana sp. 5 TL-2023]
MYHRFHHLPVPGSHQPSVSDTHPSAGSNVPDATRSAAHHAAHQPVDDQGARHQAQGHAHRQDYPEDHARVRHDEYANSENDFDLLLTTLQTPTRPISTTFPPLTRQEGRQRRPTLFERLRNMIRRPFTRSHGVIGPRQRPFGHRREGAHQDFSPARRAFEAPRTNGPVWREGTNPLTGEALLRRSRAELRPPPPPYHRIEAPPPGYVSEPDTNRNSISVYVFLRTENAPNVSFTSLQGSEYDGDDEL